MTKQLEGVEIKLRVWAKVVLDKAEIEDTFPDLANYDLDEDLEEIGQVIREHMDLYYMDHITYAEGAMDECEVSLSISDEESD